MSHRIPEQCLEICPLAKWNGVHDYPIVFSRNCSGPESGDDRGIETKVYVSKSGETSVEPGIGNSMGKLVCVNAGANLSLDALIE